MKTVITSTGEEPGARFDLRFGRAGWLCLVDDETGETKFFRNEFKDAQHGAGRKVVEKVVEYGACRVISGDFGPRAKELLENLNIQMVILQDKNQTVSDIIDKLIKHSS